MQPSEVAADDRAGLRYWDDLWIGQELPLPIDPRARGWRNNVNRRLDAFFRAAFSARVPVGGTLLEIGCGASALLPYFANEHGLEVSGLDYSPEGCAQAQRILARDGASGRIACSDLFIPPRDMLGAFDVVASFGVAEHFSDTDACIRTIATFAKRGGLVVTVVPNLGGLPGAIHRLLNRKVYEAHVPLTPHRLRDAHVRTGLTILEARHLISIFFDEKNLLGLDPKRLSTRVKRTLVRALNVVSAVVWAIESVVRRELPATRALSPYVVVLAKRPAVAPG